MVLGMEARYSTYYTSAAGQPQNNEQTHNDLADAVLAWKYNCGALLLRSGGKSVLIDNEAASRLEWVEHCEGGFVTAQGGTWEDDIDNATQLAREDGEAPLTPDQAADIIIR